MTDTPIEAPSTTVADEADAALTAFAAAESKINLARMALRSVIASEHDRKTAAEHAADAVKATRAAVNILGSAEDAVRNCAALLPGGDQR